MPDASAAKTFAAPSSRALILVSGFALTAGVVIYALLRPEGLRAGAWLGELWPSSRTWTWEGALAGSLPGGLWMFSATAIQAAIWTNRADWARRVWVLAPLALGLVWEFGQASGAISGTADHLDLVAYVAGWTVAAMLSARGEPAI